MSEKTLFKILKCIVNTLGSTCASYTKFAIIECKNAPNLYVGQVSHMLCSIYFFNIVNFYFLIHIYFLYVLF